MWPESQSGKGKPQGRGERGEQLQGRVMYLYRLGEFSGRAAREGQEAAPTYIRQKLSVFAFRK